MPNELAGKFAVVTGGSRGIGFAIVEALASRGCKVVFTFRNNESSHAAAAKLKAANLSAIPIQCDVRDEQAIRRLFEVLGEKFGQIDFLINNAGIFGPAVAVDQVPTEGWREALDTNLTGTFLCTKYAVPLMQRGAIIVNNLSVAATQAFPNSAAYAASKQGALGLTNGMREDLRSRGIRVIALMPGATETEIWNQFWPDAPREKMMQAQDVAEAVVAALLMPERTSMDEIRIHPAVGRL
ncbi:MAG TPA: SDR family NAD(P)-dependent oxidoreductase [Terriglobales bacterium]|nr:SDR family NAD(P)-dependent oxidoreductase [Terriglobales bacterium]